MKGFSFEIRENGSVNHPWYLRVYVDEYLVDQKSFKSAKAAEKGKETYIEELLVRMTRSARAFSKAHQETENQTVGYPGQPSTFRGTGHAED